MAKAALESVGVPVELVKPRYYGKLRLGGALIPTARMMVLGQAPGRFVHAIDVESVYRGTGVMTIHDPLTSWETGSRIKEFPYRWQLAVAVRRVKRIVTVSTSTRERVRSLFPDVHDKLVTIPPAFDTRLGESQPKDRDVVWIGRNDPEKDLPTLLDALGDPTLASLRSLVKWTAQPRWPDLTERVHAMLRRLPNVQSIEQPVDVATLNQWFAGSRCIVSTSRTEGLHAVILEAYMLRTRIVLPRMHPYLEMYDAGADGVHWYIPGDRNDLVRAIDEATHAPANFTPDAATLNRVSFRTVGAALKRTYLGAGWSGS